jgi:hypothetical protein
MKTPIAVTLIIMGALLIMSPMLLDYFHQRNLVELLSKPGVNNANLMGNVGDLYQIGCFAVGSVMIAFAVLYSYCAPRPATENFRRAETV